MIETLNSICMSQTFAGLAMQRSGDAADIGVSLMINVWFGLVNDSVIG
jgi:hypothetical protein